MQQDGDNAILDNLINSAVSKNILSQEELGFAELLVKKFRSELYIKLDRIKRLEGEISQLKSNEKIITDIIKNLVAAADRDSERRKLEQGLRQPVD